MLALQCPTGTLAQQKEEAAEGSDVSQSKHQASWVRVQELRAAAERSGPQGQVFPRARQPCDCPVQRGRRAQGAHARPAGAPLAEPAAPPRGRAASYTFTVRPAYALRASFRGTVFDPRVREPRCEGAAAAGSRSAGAQSGGRTSANGGPLASGRDSPCSAGVWAAQRGSGLRAAAAAGAVAATGVRDGSGWPDQINSDGSTPPPPSAPPPSPPAN
ncbi:uncharacterized protein LOC126128290 [Schistocerca cancellata]|uniref:uncharacterized protein LOC126128290 n=1 Tax=Schistocerca cancellata TaxID=274614 RepID=UPI002117FE5A|nr:uncharacterized protein LOC126128290 [Schistocerca cancellata]